MGEVDTRRMTWKWVCIPILFLSFLSVLISLPGALLDPTYQLHTHVLTHVHTRRHYVSTSGKRFQGTVVVVITDSPAFWCSASTVNMHPLEPTRIVEMVYLLPVDVAMFLVSNRVFFDILEANLSCFQSSSLLAFMNNSAQHIDFPRTLSRTLGCCQPHDVGGALVHHISSFWSLQC